MKRSSGPEVRTPSFPCRRRQRLRAVAHGGAQGRRLCLDEIVISDRAACPARWSTNRSRWALYKVVDVNRK
jgi:hypothetical protein